MANIRTELPAWHVGNKILFAKTHASRLIISTSALFPRPPPRLATMNFNPVLVVAGIIRSPEGRYLICRRSPHLPEGNKWEFPGGKVQPGETLEQALRRELREELHLEVTVGREIGRVPFKSGTSDYVLVGLEGAAKESAVALTVHSDSCWAASPELRNFDFACADRPFLMQLAGEINKTAST